MCSRKLQILPIQAHFIYFLYVQLVMTRTSITPHSQTTLVIAGLMLSADAQGVKGRPSYTASPSQQRASFFGQTKSKGQASENRESAIPAFVEPPPAPNPEPAGDEGSKEPGMPYSFSYTADGLDGRSARQEQSDGTTVRGSYTLEGPDGINRVVHYIADRDGFRATIETNEPGTESQNPAAVLLNSSQLPASEIALQYGPGEPLRRDSQPSAPAPVNAPLSREEEPEADLPFQSAPLQQQQPLRQQQQQQPQFRAQPQILTPARQQPSNFGFRQAAQPSARAQAVKGAAPSQRQSLLQAPVKAPRPLPPQQFQNFRAPAKAPPQPKPLPLPALRSSGKQTLQRNPRPFFLPPTTQPPPPPQVFDEPQQQQEQVQEQEPEEQQQVQEQEPEPAQQRETFQDEPQQRQNFFSRRA